MAELVFPAGINWLTTYWLAVSLAGFAANAVNLRAGFATLAAARTAEKSVRIAVVVPLALHLTAALFLAAASVGGVLGVVLAWQSGIHLTFTSRTAMIVVLALPLGLITVAGLSPILVWLRRVLALRASEKRGAP